MMMERFRLILSNTNMDNRQDKCCMSFNLEGFLAHLAEFIAIESPSHHLAGLAQAAAWIEGHFSQFGSIKRVPTPNGDILDVGAAQANVLVLCHYDTVHPVGSLPYQRNADTIVGAGVVDMKGAIVQLLWALQGQNLSKVRLLFTPDEEVGSLASRAYIEHCARSAKAVLVPECPMANHDFKIARKAVGHMHLEVFGKAAHQGVEPEAGRNAIVAMAGLVPQLLALESPNEGVTVGVNRIHGGQAINVVADYASMHIDLRAWSNVHMQQVCEHIRTLQVPEGLQLRCSGGINRPALEGWPVPSRREGRNERPLQGWPVPNETKNHCNFELLTLAQEVAQQLGHLNSFGQPLAGGRVGGGSDGSFTAALGVPTLDGLGLIGGHAHQRTEHISTKHIAIRVALLAGLIRRLIS